MHFAEHLTFLLVGLAIGSVLQPLSDSAKIATLLAAFFGHMGYATILVAPWNIHVYPLFSVADQGILGWALLLTGWSFLIGVAYILMKNPAWLGGFSGKATKPMAEKVSVRQAKIPTWTASVVSITLIIVLLGYFAATAVALAVAPAPTQSGAVVYIVETPISWQYSPQHVTVVLGMNNALTWISHSIAYDTVTEDSGLFGSGTIPPGGSFGYTFTEPGVYSYHCVFHPWMVGKVTMLSKQG